MFRIIENQFRPDGQVNALDESRQTRNSALSYFHERISKMYVTELYTHVAIAVYDENLKEIDRRIVETMYKPPVVEQPTEQPTEKFIVDGQEIGYYDGDNIVITDSELIDINLKEQFSEPTEEVAE